MKPVKHNRYEVGKWLLDKMPSWWADIYVGGDLYVTEMTCREICFPQGLCVTVNSIHYIFGGGTELGTRIGMIQYPPFPENEEDLLKKAIMVGKMVAEANFQWSFTIVTPNENLFFSRRKK